LFVLGKLYAGKLYAGIYRQPSAWYFPAAFGLVFPGGLRLGIPGSLKNILFTI
jgi:hypothetical protein